MKACVLTDWQNLELKEVPDYVLENDEVLVEVVYGGVCGSDVTVFNHKHPTATVPRILCHEILGIVKEIKSDKKLPYKVGDKVVVFPLKYCGTCKPCLLGHTSACHNLQIRGLHLDGGFAEYCKADIYSIIPVDQNLPNKVAILTEPVSVSYHGNCIAGTKSGDHVLVIGGGPIGLLTAVVAHYFGAHVTVSEPNDARRKTASEFGMDVVNPIETDVAEYMKEKTFGVGADIVFEVSGTQAGFDAAIPAVSECGVIVPIAIPSEKRAFQTNIFILKEAQIRGMRCCPLNEFKRAAEMLADVYNRKLYPIERLIAKELPLSQVKEGIDLQASGKLDGKVIIKIKEN